MSDFDSLDDAQLRIKLLEYGYSAGPVTLTTRKILLKKLKNLVESGKGSSSSRHSMAARYSSDETDDDSIANLKKKKKISSSTRRQTLANPMPPPMVPVIHTPIPAKNHKRMSSRNPASLVPTNSESPPKIPTNNGQPEAEAKKEKNHTKHKKSSSQNSACETGSDTDALEEENLPKVVTKFGGGTTKVHDNNSQNSPTWKSTRDTHHDRFSVSLPKVNVSDVPLPKKEDILSTYESPFLSEFTRRLSVQTSMNAPKNVYKGTKYRTSTLGNTPETKESDIANGHYTSPIRPKYQSNTSMAYMNTTLDQTRDLINKTLKPPNSIHEESKNSQNFVSMALLGVVGFFFIAIAVAYLGLEGKTDTFPALPVDSDIPICSPHTPHQNRPGENCVPESSLKDLGHLIKRLHPILTKRAISAGCSGNTEKPFLTASQIIQMFIPTPTSDELKKMTADVAGVYLLIMKNPKWGMFLVDTVKTNEEMEILDTMEKYLIAKSQDQVGIMVGKPDLPLGCHLKKKMMSILSAILVAAIGALTIIGCQKAVYIYYNHKRNSEKEVFNLVSEIISMLEMHHQTFASSSPGGSTETYLAINHIRDNLIAPKDRKKLSALWEKAVKFLDENESRIRREVQLVAGEEFAVWRWLPSNSTASSSPGSSVKMSKVWQGSAFETMDGSVNSLACSPTPCLKIRHMFDPDVEFEDDWEVKVQDAILDKCGEGVNILHIRVDRGSREGCVYLKCMSQEDAGKAYKALHGCWFDGHLVTVKYLRLERYYERFPDAVNFNTPMKPSNNQRLSMQASYWANSSEAN